jgi:hypothetical protein
MTLTVHCRKIKLCFLAAKILILIFKCSYQRILHRNLMEMANFVDSMFGVYSNEEVVRSDNPDLNYIC